MSGSSLEQVRRIFTAWAPYYDLTHGSRLLLRRRARLALAVATGDRVLEIACGTGLNLPHLRQLVGERGRVVGLDLVSEMLAVARRRIGRQGWTNVSLVQADAARLPFREECFDRVLCTFALNIIPEYRDAVREVERVLAPGGRFVALEVSLTADSVPRWLGPLVQRVVGTCAIDLSHRSLEAIRDIFGGVEVQRHWLGMIFIAVADKKRALRAPTSSEPPGPVSGRHNVGRGLPRRR